VISVWKIRADTLKVEHNKRNIERDNNTTHFFFYMFARRRKAVPDDNGGTIALTAFVKRIRARGRSSWKIIFDKRYRIDRRWKWRRTNRRFFSGQRFDLRGVWKSLVWFLHCAFKSRTRHRATIGNRNRRLKFKVSFLYGGQLKMKRCAVPAIICNNFSRNGWVASPVARFGISPIYPAKKFTGTENRDGIISRGCKI